MTTRLTKASKRARSAHPASSASACRIKGSKSPAAKAEAKVTRSNACPLVMIEWEDSAQPIPSWSYLASFNAPGIIVCASVSWMIRDDDQMKALAPTWERLTTKTACKFLE